MRGKVQDAIDNSWVDTRAPKSWRPYLRLSRFDRPVGAWLLFIPCALGAFLSGAIANAPFLDVVHFVTVCFLGSWLMRGAGCTWNDIVDRKIDAQVERTRSRPIPAGDVGVSGALIWMMAQSLVALMALVTLSLHSIIFAILSLLIVALYPFAKRFTNWPQIVLGLAFNWGVLLAWVQLVGRIDVSAICLYFAMVFWTLFYDTIYAFQDIKDDENIGVKSTARALKHSPENWLERFLAMMWLMMFLSLLAARITHPIFWLSSVFFLILLEHMRREFNPDDRAMCLRQFRRNVAAGQSLVVVWGFAYLFFV